MSGQSSKMWRKICNNLTNPISQLSSWTFDQNEKK